jgi:hypothetical protein
MNSRSLRFSTLTFLALFILSQALTACNLPNRTTSATPDKNAISTSVAKTLTAAAPSSIPILQKSPLPSATSLSLEPTATFLPTQPLAATPTATIAPPPTLGPSTPLIIADLDTNCRTGPDKVYPRVGYLLKGQQSTIQGRNDDNTWWYIENPGKPGTFCWAWSGSTHVQGNVSLLPVIAAPPTPTALPGADIVVYFSNLHKCGGEPTLIFQVMNNGTAKLKSVSITIFDVTENDTLNGPEIHNMPFMYSSGDCPPGADNLSAGMLGYIGIRIDSPVPSGDITRAYITLCTEKGLDGDCVDTTVQFSMP